jgi:hypothetical protein
MICSSLLFSQMAISFLLLSALLLSGSATAVSVDKSTTTRRRSLKGGGMGMGMGMGKGMKGGGMKATTAPTMKGGCTTTAPTVSPQNRWCTSIQSNCVAPTGVKVLVFQVTYTLLRAPTTDLYVDAADGTGFYAGYVLSTAFNVATTAGAIQVSYFSSATNQLSMTFQANVFPSFGGPAVPPITDLFKALVAGFAGKGLIEYFNHQFAPIIPFYNMTATMLSPCLTASCG